jgi:hypothetical protein
MDIVSNRVARIHEAGHAVGRILTAEALGWKAVEAVTYIDIHAGNGVRINDAYISESVTFDPILSAAMDTYTQDQLRKKGLKEGTINSQMFRDMRVAGIDVDGWFRARTIYTVLASMAEARFLGLAFAQVWYADAASSDMSGLQRDADLASLSWEARHAGITDAKKLIERPEVWRAINALADALKPGRTDGRVVAEIVGGVLEGLKRPEMLAGEFYGRPGT